jgi:hypothetical protein
MHFMPRSPRLSALALLLVAGCGDGRPVPTLDFSRTPLVAAEFRTRTEAADGNAASSQWRLWRGPDRIERENLDTRTGDLWVRDGATLFHTRLYHADRRGIEYRSEDLRLLGPTPDWRSLATLLDPRLLQTLQEKSSGWRDDYPYRRYTGESGGFEWDITVRTDQMLPVRIERRSADKAVQTIELLQSFAAAAVPWQPTNSIAYDIIDYADLGDLERDPFVMRILAQESGRHMQGHGH